VTGGRLPSSFQFIFRNEPGDAYLAAVSKFILNAFDFGDATAPEESLQPEEVPPEETVPPDEKSATENRKRAESVSSPHNAPYLSEFDPCIVRVILTDRRSGNIPNGDSRR
jgi:hypothetical protein